MNIAISKPNLYDKEEIYNLFKITIVDTFIKEGIYLEYFDDINIEVENQNKLLDNYFESKDNSFFILKSDNKIIGTIAYGAINNDIKENIDKKFNKAVEVKSVYVLPEYQAKGIGKILLKSILEELSKNRIKEFYLDSGYKLAQHFWEKTLGDPFIVIKNKWGQGNHYMIWKVGVDNLLANSVNSL